MQTICMQKKDITFVQDFFHKDQQSVFFASVSIENTPLCYGIKSLRF
jgi:hypothetical protein